MTAACHAALHQACNVFVFGSNGSYDPNRLHHILSCLDDAGMDDTQLEVQVKVPVAALVCLCACVLVCLCACVLVCLCACVLVCSCACVLVAWLAYLSWRVRL